MVNLRLCALGVNDPITLPIAAEGGADPRPALQGTRGVVFDAGGPVETAVYDRARLRPGMLVPGPAVVEEETSATLLPPGCRARVAADGGLFVRLGEAS